MAINAETLKDIKNQANNLKQSNAIKQDNFTEALEAYLMTWDEQPGGENIKITISPSARNAVTGAVRLLSGSEPLITVTREVDTLTTALNDQVEEALAVMWRESGQIEGSEVHLDASMSAVLFGEVHLAVELTSEVAKRMQGGKGKAQKRMAEKLVARTPIRFRALNPQLGHVRRGAGGISAYFRQEDVTRGELRTSFPDLMPGDDASKVTLNEWWDLVYHVVWIDGEDQPLLEVEHELPFIPVAVAYADGSSLFAKPEENSQPFLYTLIKSGIQQRESLMLTVMYTKLFQYGMTPPLIIEGGQPGDTFRFDADQPLPVGYVPAGARVSYPMTNIIDPNIYKAMDLARNLGEQSTIYQQALGAPLEGGNNPYSSIALLSQAGRLPLVGPQKAISKAIGEAMGLALEWLREEGGADHALLADVDLNTDYKVEVKLDIKMPQDTLRNAQIGAQITGGPNPFLSKEWWYENAMGINNTDEIRQKIAIEQAYGAAFATALQGQVQASQMQMQAAAQQGQPQPGQPGQPQQAPQAPQQGQPQQPPQGMPGPDGAMQVPLDPGQSGGAGGQSAQLAALMNGAGGMNG